MAIAETVGKCDLIVRQALIDTQFMFLLSKNGIWPYL